jgi:ATP-dependent helicase/nuclease subunit A
MVGDVKQSIYRFRNANPNIFRYKYNCYAKGLGGIKIDLLKNFRSREEVLSNINLIFDYIMSDLIGGADYIKEHEMVFGNIAYNEEGKTNQNNNFELYQYEYNKELGFKEEEIEAFIIANDILNKVNNHYQVFDKDEKKLRDITFNDFSILIDRSTNFELYKKIFLYKQIPLSIYKDEYLNNSSLFLVIRNIFKLINLVYENKHNKEMEYTYLSIGRSFLCNYSTVIQVISKTLD